MDIKTLRRIGSLAREISKAATFDERNELYRQSDPNEREQLEEAVQVLDDINIDAEASDIVCHHSVEARRRALAKVPKPIQKQVEARVREIFERRKSFQ
jgi:hypothetical protein